MAVIYGVPLETLPYVATTN